MATTAATIQEYLTSVYESDCDYVDGEVQERNTGTFDHSRLQGAVFAYFYNRRKEWGITVVPEQRVQVSPTRFRVPDVCVTLGKLFRIEPFVGLAFQPDGF